jgi:NAD(P)-dependent dehydrogenase (short-subunit alcohol dehydrogenase family)
MGLQLEANKTCLITGASKGLGEVLAQRFWAAGFSLHLVARSKDGLDSVKASLLVRENQTCEVYVCDLAEQRSVNELVVEVKAGSPRLDVLINNAAIHGPIGSLWESDFTEWLQAIQVDLLSPVALCHALVPWMKETGGGSIINISGGGATGPRPNFSAYGTAKAAMVRFSETLAEEAREIGIRVNCIAPGAMKTALLGEVLEKGAHASGDREYATASKVFAEGGASMDRVADLALFLASEASNGITGKLISAVWDNWGDWPQHLDELNKSDVYTLRRIAGRDRNMSWGDK